MKTLSSALFVFLLTAASIAQASFYDSFFGKEEPEAPKETSTLETAAAVSAGLLPSLTGQLGVSDKQAEGGMGALLGLAKTNLSAGEFTQLGKGIPGMDGLLAAAPAITSNSSGLLSNLGGLSDSVGGIAKLTQQFQALGLSPEMISQFASVAVEYFSQNGNETGALLKKGLMSALG